MHIYMNNHMQILTLNYIPLLQKLHPAEITPHLYEQSHANIDPKLHPNEAKKFRKYLFANHTKFEKN